MGLSDFFRDTNKGCNEAYSDGAMIALLNKAIRLTKESRTEVQLAQIIDNIRAGDPKWIDPILSAVKKEKSEKFNAVLAQIRELNDIRNGEK